MIKLEALSSLGYKGISMDGLKSFKWSNVNHCEMFFVSKIDRDKTKTL